mmetsp:Transcript_44857/g.134064  ORF Transcript_44857/g.134064 Transcript_44857/m.134064 type:complete len:219 (+) Transcript_44857:59-715(+)
MRERETAPDLTLTPSGAASKVLPCHLPAAVAGTPCTTAPSGSGSGILSGPEVRWRHRLERRLLRRLRRRHRGGNSGCSDCEGSAPRPGDHLHGPRGTTGCRWWRSLQEGKGPHGWRRRRGWLQGVEAVPQRQRQAARASGLRLLHRRRQRGQVIKQPDLYGTWLGIRRPRTAAWLLPGVEPRGCQRRRRPERRLQEGVLGRIVGRRGHRRSGRPDGSP